MSKPFFFRIESADLLNFATDPEGEGMSLLRFAKELQKGESEIEFIQDIIDEARNYIEKKKKAGSKGGKARASSAKAALESAGANTSTPQASSSTEAVAVTETIKPKPLKPVRRFTPPSTQEVEEYCQQRKKGVDSERWMNHYESNGWKVGKNKMVDWKAAVRTWENKSSSPDKPKQQARPMPGINY